MGNFLNCQACATNGEQVCAVRGSSVVERLYLSTYHPSIHSLTDASGRQGWAGVPPSNPVVVESARPLSSCWTAWRGARRLCLTLTAAAHLSRCVRQVRQRRRCP